MNSMYSLNLIKKPKGLIIIIFFSIMNISYSQDYIVLYLQGKCVNENWETSNTALVFLIGNESEDWETLPRSLDQMGFKNIFDSEFMQPIDSSSMVMDRYLSQKCFNRLDSIIFKNSDSLFLNDTAYNISKHKGNLEFFYFSGENVVKNKSVKINSKEQLFEIFYTLMYNESIKAEEISKAFVEEINFFRFCISMSCYSVTHTEFESKYSELKKKKE